MAKGNQQTEQDRAQTLYQSIAAKSAKIRSRALYPGDQEWITRIMEECVRDQKPIPMVICWAKGPTDEIDPEEVEGVNFLADSLRRVTAGYAPGVSLQVVFADTHEKLNNNTVPDGYLDKVAQLFREHFQDDAKGLHLRGISRLSDYLTPEQDYTATVDGIEKLWTLACQNQLQGALKDKLAPRAQRYYRGSSEGDAPPAQSERIAAMYHQLCLSERAPIGQAFKDQIFLTYNPATQHDFSVPEGMPAFCMYSLPSRISDKPWNISLKRQQAQQQGAAMTSTQEPNTIAVVGGGLAGLATAYQLAKAKPEAALTVYEKGGEDSYTAGEDGTHRASLGSSGARTMRLSGASTGVGIWNVEQTMQMLRELQPYSDKPLFHSEASVYLPKDGEIDASGAPEANSTYVKYRASLQQSGVRYSEITGRQLKERFPGYYNTVPDNRLALVEEPYDADRNPKGAAGYMDIEATMQAMQHYLKEHGATIRYDADVQGPVKDGTVTLADGSSEAYDQVVVAPGHWIEDLVDCERHGIQPYYDKVPVVSLDMKAAGIETKGFPFTKGWTPSDIASGSFYNADADPESGKIKFLPTALMKSSGTAADVETPLTEEEKEASLQATSERFGVPLETVRQYADVSQCSFTRTAKGEQMLVGRLDDKTTVIGLDSSGSARVIGGLSQLAAADALGRPEPHAGADATFNLAAHHQKVGAQMQAGPATATGIGAGREQGPEVRAAAM